MVALLSLATSLGCKRDESSRLRERSQTVTTPAEAPRGDAGSAPASASPAERPASPADDVTDANAPPPDGEYVSLRLALPQGETYRMTTVAMVELPMVNQPVGYAREESLTFEDCIGDGVERACTLRHRYTAFEAQPPTGPLLEADERKVQGVTSLHRITATGFRDGETELKDDASDLDPGIRENLTSIHRLYCIRFPKEPVAVGAKWNDVCHTFDRGVAVTRNLLWELSELSEDPDDPDMGKRAELRGIGEYVVPGPKGERKGTVEMVLYFFVDHGEPHLLRERRSIPVSAERGAFTKETVSIQFAKVLEGEPERVVRTDGRPFPSTDTTQGVEPAPDARPDAPVTDE